MATITNATVKQQRFESTQTTGVSPLVVASTTVVANLNADLLDGQEGAYYTSLANATGTLAWASVSKTGSSLADLATASAGDLSSGTLLDARVAASNVTQHEAALSIAASQLTGTLADARVAETNVTQHQAALSIAATQLTGTLADARLSSNVPLKDTTSIFTAAQAFRRSLAANDVWTVRVTTDSSDRFVAKADGGFRWGDGTAAQDTNLYRSAADTLKTDDSFVVGATLTVDGTGTHTFAGPVSSTSLLSGSFAEITDGTPSNPAANKARIYWDEAGGSVKAVDSAGTVISLGSAGGAITDAYASIAGDSGTASASGGAQISFVGSGGISTTAADGTPDTLTITLGNHSADLLTSGTVATARISGAYTGITQVGTLTAGTWNATAIGPTYGGTGLTTYATGDILYASASNTLAKLTAGTNGQVLTLASGVPTWASGGSDNSNTGDVTLTADSDSSGGGEIVFMTGVNTRGKITNGGNLLINSPTYTTSKISLHYSGSTENGLVVNDTDSASPANAVRFHRGGTMVGNITTNSGSTLYNSSSDERLKTLHGQSETGLEALRQITIYDGEFKADPGNRMQMLSAQEVQRFAPWAVSEDEGGFLSMDYGRLTPWLALAIQQLDIRLTALERD